MILCQGSGYCHPNADMFDEPLDEYVRSLFQEDPDAAREVFESYGLYTVPMASIYELLGSKAWFYMDMAFPETKK